MSNAVVEAVVGLKVRIGSVPFGVRVSLWSRIGQEMMCPFRADAYATPCRGTQNLSTVFRFLPLEKYNISPPYCYKNGVFPPNDLSVVTSDLQYPSQALLLAELKGGRDHVRHSFCTYADRSATLFKWQVDHLTNVLETNLMRREDGTKPSAETPGKPS